MRYFVVIILLGTKAWLIAQQEPYLENQTYTYEQAIAEYQNLAQKFPKYSSFQNFGSSDYGLPISLFLINKTGKFTPRELQNKAVFLINNAIHPGEPEGVDASIKLVKELLLDTSKIPNDVILAIIPLYNIGGANNRNCCSRTNQNGPEEYGFRGNAKNLDLNRDFIKADSKNTLAFYAIFQFLKPVLFVDTHTSNGADYQYVMTLITSQVDKMNPVLKEYVEEIVNPELYKRMEKQGFPMIPYVNTIKEIPDDGIVDYLETPRYSTGYTNLFNCISFVAETHMLKPFDQRVEATYELLKIMLNFAQENHVKLLEKKKLANENLLATKEFPLNWKLDTSKFEMLSFLGYEAVYKPSDVTGHTRLYYDRNKPYKKSIKYFNHYKAVDFVSRPDYYIIPQAWDIVVEKMTKSNIKVFRLAIDTTLEVEQYAVTSFETVKGPYEGHYLHYNIEVEKRTAMIGYRAGDYIIPTNNENVRFIIETLEPHAADSYLAWNYFDAVLQQKEWFSAYVFEDEAMSVLNANPTLKKEFEEKRKSDPEFSANAFAQLYFIYKGSNHYEPTHNKYPVTRYNQQLKSELLLEIIAR